MKFSDFFATPGVRRVSLYLGVLVGLGVALLTDWRYGVLVGAVTVLLVSLLLPVILYFSFLPYARMKKSLPRPFLFDGPVQFTVKKGRVSGFFVLTEGSMFLLSKDCSDETMELTRDKVLRTVAKRESMTLDIYVNETQFIRVFSGVWEELVDILRKNGWNVTE